MLVPPIPDRTPLVVFPDKGSSGNPYAQLGWLQWLRQLVTLINGRAQVGSVTLPDQTASVASTPIATPVLSQGLYRVSWYARITRAAGTSSSLTVTVRWKDGDVACSFTGPAMTGNGVTDTQSESVLVSADQSVSGDPSTLDYQATYVSVGSPTMKYSLQVVVEALNA